MSEKTERSFWQHRMGKFGLFIVALFTVWFGGWFLAANYIDGKIDDVFAKLADRGRSLECSGKTIRGFPFRMGLNCDEVRFGGTRTGIAAKTGALRTTSIIYDPTEMITELDSPALLWFGGPEIVLNWDKMRLYSNVTTDGGLQGVSLNFEKLRANEGEADIRAQAGAVHLRPTPEQGNDLDIALDLQKFNVFSPVGGTLDPTDLFLDIHITDGHERIIKQRKPMRQILSEGMSGAIRAIKISVDGGGILALSGPLSIDEFGTVSGDMQIGVTNPKALKRWASTINKQVENGVGILAAAVASTGKAAQIAGSDVKTIKVSIKDGRVRLGFLELLRIPPLKF